MYQALLAGERIRWDTDILHLNEEGILVDENSNQETWHFKCYEDWIIYKEPKWYENIPKDKLLCWFWENDGDNQDNRARILLEYSERHGFISDNGTAWKNCRRLTKQEIQLFMDNAPEEV